jgi:deoxyribodipyrimidine photo-lyase
VPLFVLDDDLLGSRFAAPNRLGFLLESLADLRAALRERGGDLVVRRGDVVGEALALAEAVDARAVLASADVSAYARGRERRLSRALAAAGRELVLYPGTTVVPADRLLTGDGTHYKVFTPYSRAWFAAPWRAVEPPPDALRMPDVEAGAIPPLSDLTGGERSPSVMTGGEAEGRARAERWMSAGVADYADGHDDLPGDRTSRLSPYLHFGCVSALELAVRLLDREGGHEYVRQLCWRDFHHQTAYAFPEIARAPFRDRGYRWREDPEQLRAWKEGRTGIPIVDAGMRQLRAEGWMHNRTRMITASFLAKQLYLDWREGARHFAHWLVDGDLANNWANWQWVAGTGTDTRPNRLFSPLRQAERFDPEGVYVRRYVPELAEVPGGRAHRPWEIEDDLLGARPDYPEPIVDLEAAAARFRELRG